MNRECIAKELVLIARGLVAKKPPYERQLIDLDAAIHGAHVAFMKESKRGEQKKAQKILESIGKMTKKRDEYLDLRDIAMRRPPVARELVAAQWTVTVETMPSSAGSRSPETVEEEAFDSKKDADKFKREMMKKYKMKRHAGHIVNYKDRFELFTNY